KLFMGSSTGNMLVDDEKTLRNIFCRVKLPLACHCEDEQVIRKNIEKYRLVYGNEIPVKVHPLIRSREACFMSSSHAVNLAKEYNTRAHILHLSTADEMELFSKSTSVDSKRIT